MIYIRHSEINEKRKVYDWLCNSDVTPLMLGEHLGSDIPSFDDFEEDFEDFYFQEEKKNLGSLMIIQKDLEEIGCISYSTILLNPNIAEIDVWLKQLSLLGKGFGTKAIQLLLQYLNVHLKMNKFLIRPYIRNDRAIQAYQKSGFKMIAGVELDKILKEWYKPEISDEIRNGDYGKEFTATLIREIPV
ncbi:MAG: GNAT family N-acetyltransferase [Leptospiraceae bacterium]|nr:GNAT family N-acetyltransferase [Leptospiraceae bacterium]